MMHFISVVMQSASIVGMGSFDSAAIPDSWRPFFATWIVGILGVAAIVVLALLISQSIVRPVKGVVNSLTELTHGEGDLTLRLPAGGSDEMGDLARRFNEFMEKLHTMVRDIVKGVQTLSSSFTELSAISQQMSTSAEQTSSKSSTVAAAAEQMSAEELSTVSEQLNALVKRFKI